MTLALNKIMADITENPSYFTEMSYEQRLIICREINSLIDQKEGPTNREEHYFRNHLNYAPPNLDAMLKEIKSQKVIKWALMESGQSVYHMFGKNGEYNLKFVSGDGLFEAVYDKDGVLLTAKNDAVNMGTYNYASPVNDPNKHTVYDVLPYNVWGNTLFSLSKSDESAVDNLDKFSASADAAQRYEQVRLLIESE